MVSTFTPLLELNLYLTPHLAPKMSKFYNKLIANKLLEILMSIIKKLIQS